MGTSLGSQQHLQAVLGISPKRLQQVIGTARNNGHTECRLARLAASLPGRTRAAYAEPGSCAGETPPELLACLQALTPQEFASIVALAWIGRGTYEPGEWEEALSEARAAQGARLTDYVATLPMLAETLDEGLAALSQERGVSLA